MLKKQALNVLEINASTEGDRFVVSINLENQSDKIVYAYASPRRVFYDNASGILTLELHDQNMPKEHDQIEFHLQEPRIVPIEPGSPSMIRVSLEPLMRRLRPSSERGEGDLFEELHVADAKEVEVEIGHQDAPFYYNPKHGNVKQLKEWGSVLTKGRSILKSGRN